MHENLPVFGFLQVFLWLHSDTLWLLTEGGLASIRYKHSSQWKDTVGDMRKWMRRNRRDVMRLRKMRCEHSVVNKMVDHTEPSWFYGPEDSSWNLWIS